jgi:hypothetical protein
MAESLYSQTLEIRRRVLGPDNPFIPAAMNNLAIVRGDEGKYAQAEALDRQALEIRRRVLGPEHPETLMSMDNLACDYTHDGKYVQAEALFARTLEVQRRVMGSESQGTLSTLSDAASMYQREGKYALAEAYAAGTLAAWRRKLGAQSAVTMEAAAGMVLAYLSQGKFAESESLAREAVEFDRKNRTDDWQRFRAESLLGASLAGQKKYAEAEPLLLDGYQGMAAGKTACQFRTGIISTVPVNGLLNSTRRGASPTKPANGGRSEIGATSSLDPLFSTPAPSALCYLRKINRSDAIPYSTCS